MSNPKGRRPENPHHVNEATERTPLITNASQSERHDQTLKPQDFAEETPLPKSKILLLSLTRYDLVSWVG